MWSYDESGNPKIWVRAAAYSIGLCMVGIFLASFLALTRVRAMPIGKSMDVTLGPLHFYSVHKAAAQESYSLIVHFKIGLLVLLLLCVIIELLVIWGMHCISQKPPPDA